MQCLVGRYTHCHCQWHVPLSKWLDIFNLLVGLPCWILIPQPGIEPMPPDTEVLITGPLGKFLARHFHIHTAEYKIIIKVTMGAQSQKVISNLSTLMVHWMIILVLPRQKIQQIYHISVTFKCTL